MNGDGKFDLVALRREMNLARRADESIAAFDAQTQGPTGQMDLLHACAAAGILVEAVLHGLLTKIFAKSDWARFDAVCADETLGNPDIRAYHRQFAAFYSHDRATTFDETLAAYRATSSASILTRHFQRLLVSLAAQEKNWAYIETWLEIVPDGEIANLAGHFVVNVTSSMMLEGQHALAHALLSRGRPHMTPLNQLKTELNAHRASGATDAPFNHLDLLDRIEPAGGPTGHNWTWLKTQYRGALDRAADTFMDIRVDPDEMSRLFEIFRGAMAERRPLSFVRIGDGEAYTMPMPRGVDVPPGVLAADDARREMVWWGRSVSPDQRARIAQNFRETITDADIIGIPASYRFLRDCGAGDLLKDKTNGRAMMQIFSAFDRLWPLDGKVITEERSHHLVFTRERLVELIDLADRVVIVGCLDPASLDLQLGDKVDAISITPETKLGSALIPGARSIVDDWAAISQEVTSLCGPGTLLLVAAGYGGKKLCTLGKAEGAVAIDVGAVVDFLAGFESRAISDRF